MLGGMFDGADGLGPQSTLRDVIYGLGLEANLRLCLDAGDPASYPPAGGQLWKDTSGGGFDFNRGSTGSASTDDPTFNGVAGNQSKNEYFSYDGGDRFKLAGSMPSWLQSFTKDNAKLTIVEWVYANNVTSVSDVCGEIFVGASFSESGFYFGNSSNSALKLNIGVATSSTYIAQVDSSISFVNNQWNMIGTSLNETASSLIFMVNGATETKTASYSAPSTSNTSAAYIGGDANTPDFEHSGNRVAAVAIWDAPLTAAQMTALFTATRDRFGI